MIKKTAAVFLLLIIASVIFCAGCVSDAPCAKDGDHVSVYYTLSVDGAIQESNVGKTPLEFTLGSGAMIKGFNDGVIGMKAGETKTITVKPEDGYGVYTKEKTNEFPLSDVEAAVGDVVVGQILYLNGGQLIAEILSIDRENNLIEAAVNHHMAGKTLVFEITLDKVGA